MLPDPVVVAIGGAVGKALAARFLSSDLEDLPGSIGEVVARTGLSALKKRKATKTFEQIGEDIAARVSPLFERNAASGNLNAEAVGLAIAETVRASLTQPLVAEKDLDPEAVAAALLAHDRSDIQLLSEAETALYQRVIQETAQYAVEAAHALPGFGTAVSEQTLSRLTAIQAETEAVLDRLDDLKEQVAASTHAASAEIDRYEVNYRRAVARALDRVELFGVDVPATSQQLPLSVAYVGLNAKAGGGETTLGAAGLLDAVALSSQRLLIRGPAGSGKTTLFRWVAVQAAERTADDSSALDLRLDDNQPDLERLLGALPDASFGLQRSVLGREAQTLPTAILSGGFGSGKTAAMEALFDSVRGGAPEFEWRNRIPFLLRLRDIKEGRLPAPAEFPDYVAREIGVPPARWVETILRDGRALVLLDGVDEVPNADRRGLRDAIEAIVETYPKNLYVVSTRPEAVDPNWLVHLHFQEAEVAPLTSSGRADLVRNWHRALAVAQDDPIQVDATRQKGERLITQLTETPRVAHLATNPLLCAMVCALHHERHEQLPDTVRELCDAACSMLLHRRELESGVHPERFAGNYAHLSYEQKRALIQDLAYHMVLNGDSSINEDVASERVGRCLRSLPGAVSDTFAPHDVLDRLVERSGVLRRAKPGSIEFVHNTLKEFLAAERFVEEYNVGFLADRFFDPAFEPVLLFACSERSRTFATELIQKVLSPFTAPDRDDRERRVFAVRARAAALHLDPDLAEEIRGFEKDLFPPRSMSDAAVLAEIGESVLPYLRYKKRLRAREAAASIRTLRLIGTPKAKAEIRRYLANTTKSAAAELVQALDPLEVPTVRRELTRPDVYPWVMRRGIAGHQTRRRVRDLRLLDGTQAEFLDLLGTSVSDLEPLRAHAELRWLNVSHSRVASLQPLEGHESLITVVARGLDHAARHPVASSPVPLLPNVRSFLSGGLTANRQMGYVLRQLPRVEDLGLSEPEIGERGDPTEHPALRRLALNDPRMEHPNGPVLPSLESLAVRFEEEPEVGMTWEWVSRLPSLRELSVISHRNVPVPLDGLTLPALRKLSVFRVGADVLDWIETLPSLTHLSLFDHAPTALERLSRLRHLEVLNVSSMEIEDYGLLTRFPNLRSITISPDEAFLEVARDLKSLEGVSVVPYYRGRTLEEARGRSKSFIERVRAVLPHLERAPEPERGNRSVYEFEVGAPSAWNEVFLRDHARDDEAYIF